MMLLKAVGLPDTCYVPEVAYWIAFGRVPESFPYDEQADVREDLEAMLSGDANPLDWFDNGFSWREFASVGVEIDYERYVDGFASESSQTWKREFMARLADKENPALPDDERMKLLEEVADDYRKDQVELEWKTRQERLMKPTVSRARATVFQALASGDLKSFGYVETDKYKARLEDDDPGAPWLDASEYLLRVEIPADVWTLDEFDWQRSTLRTPDATYKYVQVTTEDMMRIFPKPHCQSFELSCEAYCNVVIAKDKDAIVRTPPPSKRGRRERTYNIKTAIQRWLKRTLKENPNYGASAPETIVQDAIAFAETYLGEDVPRSTMQNYVDAVAFTLPKIAASNSPKIAAGNLPEIAAR